MQNDVPELFRILSGLWEEYAKKKDFNAVMEISLASRLLFKVLPDAAGPQEAALAALHHSIEMVVFDGKPRNKSTEDIPQCSFCGRKPPEVRLGAGPDVFICDGCVRDFAAVFREGKK